MKDTDRVFPNHFCLFPSDGITVAQYAAIHLKVPRSGDPDIDAMIRESRRAEFAEAAMRIVATKCMTWPDSLIQGGWQDFLAGESGRIADSMLAEWEKEAGK
jgi:hypothetical protein